MSIQFCGSRVEMSTGTKVRDENLATCFTALEEHTFPSFDRCHLTALSILRRITSCTYVKNNQKQSSTRHGIRKDPIPEKLQCFSSRHRIPQIHKQSCRGKSEVRPRCIVVSWKDISKVVAVTKPEEQDHLVQFLLGLREEEGREKKLQVEGEATTLSSLLLFGREMRYVWNENELDEILYEKLG